MPEAFDSCVKSGGRVRTLSGPDQQFGLKEGQYRHACFKNGQSYMGHVKIKGKEKK